MLNRIKNFVSKPKPKKIAITQVEVSLDSDWANHELERVGLKYAFEYALLRFGIKGSLDLNAAELGVYRGYGLLLCAEIASRYGIKVNFYGFDSFQGLPSLSEIDLKMAPKDAAYINQTLFSDTSLESVTNLFREKRMSNVILRKGFFSETLPKEERRKYFFVHIDCDLYDPHMECLEYFYNKTEKGGIILFDDYHSVNFPMAKKAIDDFLSNKPEKLVHVRGDVIKDNFTKCFIVKS